jgi:next-to-BRCA1 protein 1
LVVHRTLPAGSVVDASATLFKTWAIRNSGDAAWPKGTKLIFLRGDRELSLDEEFPLDTNAQPGELVEVSAALVAPAAPGRFTAVFQLADEERNLFGPRLSAEVVVEKAQSAKMDAEAERAELNAVETKADQVKAAEPASPKEWVDVKAPEPEFEVKQDMVVAAAPAQAATPVAEPAAPAQSEKYREQHQFLKELGFDDEQLNSQLLEMHKGDVREVCQYLFK